MFPNVVQVFRSTPKSPPNNIYIWGSNVRYNHYITSLRPQKVFPIPMKFGKLVCR